MVDDERVTLLEHAYRLFNGRKVEQLLELMTDDIEWPDVANGVVLTDKEAIQRYWLGQFSVADPRVEPIDFVPAGEDLIAVVDQRVLDLAGEVVVPSTTVLHRYTFAGGRVG